ncbi:MAG: choice-of-anchor D domain-containing protein [Deltaproteobacteria bacterium]|nr:choice-of-anchor D domain-containing protein [Deltaproteobacteria bacterium]
MSRSVRSVAAVLFSLARPACNCGGQKATHSLEAIFEIHEWNEAGDPQIGASIADDGVIAFGAVKIERATRRSIALINTGDLVLKVEDPKLQTGTGFAISRALAPCRGSSADPHEIEVGGCRLVTLDVRPDAIGPLEDVLQLKSDDAKRSEVNLRVTAEGSRGALKVCVSSATEGSDSMLAVLDRCSSVTAKELGVELGLVALGSSAVKRRVELTNEGPVDLVIGSMRPAPGDPADFAVEPVGFHMVLPAGSIAEARMVFRPTAIGPRSGTIVVDADDPSTAPVLLRLTGQGDGAKLCMDPTAVDFGTVVLGASSDPKVVSLTSCGTKAVALAAPALEGHADFVFEGAPPTPVELPPGEKLDVQMRFAPQTVGAKRAQLKASSNDAAAPLQFAELTGNAVPPSICKLEASTGFLDFGVVVKGTRTSLPLTLHNAGNSDCTISSASVDGSSGGVRFFIESSAPPPFVMGPNDLQVIEVGYLPLDANPPDNGVLSFVSDDPLLPGGKLDVLLTGTPTPNPECRLQITPVVASGKRQLNFGVVAIGDTKKLSVTLKNVGNLDCTIQRPSLGSLMPMTANPFSFGTHTPPLPSTLRPSETQTIEVAFSPVSSTGQIPFQNNYLQVATSETTASECSIGGGGNGCKQVYLAGTGVVLAVDTVPGFLDFGQVTVGCNSVDKVVTIYNVGDAAVTLSGFSIDPASAPFTIVQSPSTPKVLSPGNSTTVSVRYRPQSATVDAAMLVIAHNFSSGQSTVQLKGTGTTQTHQLDTFQQNTEPKTDVLWVIDNSGSMSPKQDFLGDNARRFVQQANSTRNDYQMAVIATEWSESAGMGFPHKSDSSENHNANIYPGEFFGTPQVIRRSDPDPAAELAKNIKIGNCCSDSAESGLEGAKAALSNPLLSDPTKPNSTFVRPDAKLAIIMLSDEEDQGASQNVEYYIDLFQQLKGAKNTQLFALHAIAGEPPDGCSATVNGTTLSAAAGKRYHEAVTRSGGIFRSICTADWGTIATDIGLDAFAARMQYILTRACDQATLRVKVNGVLQSAGVNYTFDAASNSIVFNANSSPPPGATITAEYDAACL